MRTGRADQRVGLRLCVALCIPALSQARGDGLQTLVAPASALLRAASLRQFEPGNVASMARVQAVAQGRLCHGVQCASHHGLLGNDLQRAPSNQLIEQSPGH